MRATIYTISSNTRENGVACEVFTTDRELKRAQADIIRPGSEDDSEDANEIRSLLDENEIEEAWDYWEDNVRDPQDTYNIESHEVDVPIPAKK